MSNICAKCIYATDAFDCTKFGPRTFDIVSGATIYPSCAEQRKDRFFSTTCGQRGRFFKQREPVAFTWATPDGLDD